MILKKTAWKYNCNSIPEKDADEDELEDKAVELSAIAGGSLVHSLFTGGIDLSQEELVTPLSLHLPKVYSRRHLLFTSAPFLPMMLLSSEELLNLKGIQCLEGLTLLFENGELDKTTLEDMYFRRVLSAVTEHLLVKCPSKYIRCQATIWIKNMSPKFDVVARFFFIRGLFYSSRHSGFRGFVLTYLLKPQMQAALKAKDELVRSSSSPQKDEIATWFIGPSMKSWYSKIFSLPEGPETDLMQEQDTVMAALNLLR